MNIWGTKKVMPSATAYPGTKNHMMEIPVRIRTMARPTERAMPTDRDRLMARWVMEPLEISST